MKAIWSSPCGTKGALLKSVSSLLRPVTDMRAISGEWMLANRFPIFVDECGQVQREVFEYLREIVIRRGEAASSSTVRTYSESLLLWFNFLESRGEHWSSPRRGSLLTFRNLLMERKGVRGKAAHATVNLRMQVVFSFYEFHSLQRDGLFIQTILGIDPSHRNGSAPASGRGSQLKRLKLRAGRRRPRALTEGQAAAIYENLRGVYRLMFTWSVATGLRRSSLTSLRCHDIPENCLELAYVTVAAKGGVVVDIPMTGRLAARTRLYIESDRVAAASRRQRGTPEPEALFLDAKGRPVSNSGYYQAFRRAARKAGLAATPHMTRHTFATRLHERLTVLASENPSLNPTKVVQHWLGHRRAETTELYLEEILAPSGDVLKILSEAQDGVAGHG